MRDVSIRHCSGTQCIHKLHPPIHAQRYIPRHYPPQTLDGWAWASKAGRGILLVTRFRDVGGLAPRKGMGEQA